MNLTARDVLSGSTAIKYQPYVELLFFEARTDEYISLFALMVIVHKTRSSVLKVIS
jgi:hypothetical protein